ncbi:MAG: hypothetical protein ABI134_29195 [Byssovorax sp.]
MEQRVLLMSVMGAMIMIPMVAARDPAPARGLRRARMAVGLFVVLWSFSLLYLLPMLNN